MVEALFVLLIYHYILIVTRHVLLRKTQLFPLIIQHVSAKSTSGLTNQTSHHRPHTRPLTPSQQNRITPHSAALAPHTRTASDPHNWHLTPQTSHLTPPSSHLTHHPSHLRTHSSQIRPHTAQLTCLSNVAECCTLPPKKTISDRCCERLEANLHSLEQDIRSLGRGPSNGTNSSFPDIQDETKVSEEASPHKSTT